MTPQPDPGSEPSTFCRAVIIRGAAGRWEGKNEGLAPRDSEPTRLWPRVRIGPACRGRSQSVRQDLQSDEPLQSRVESAINVTHSTLPERADDLVRTEAGARGMRHRESENQAIKGPPSCASTSFEQLRIIEERSEARLRASFSRSRGAFEFRFSPRGTGRMPALRSLRSVRALMPALPERSENFVMLDPLSRRSVQRKGRLGMRQFLCWGLLSIMGRAVYSRARCRLVLSAVLQR